MELMNEAARRVLDGYKHLSCECYSTAVMSDAALHPDDLQEKMLLKFDTNITFCILVIHS